MNAKKKKAPAQSNWKVTEETLKKVNQACLDLDVTHAELAETALQALRAQGSYAAGTAMKPMPGDAYADFEINEEALRQLEMPARDTADFKRGSFVSAASHLPTDPDEQSLVAATLQFHRNSDVPAEFREILYVLLKRWLPKTFKAGKKTA